MVEEGIVYLNDLLDESTRQHPLKAQRDSVAHYRQIGLGFFGLADALIKLGIRYGDEESLKFIDMIGAMSVQAALYQSALLAKEYGAAPAYSEKVMESAFFKEHANKNTIKLVKEYGLRNTQLLTVAPTGSTATMFGASGGIEPLFEISYTRTTQSINDGVETKYKVFSPVVKELMKVQGIKREEDLPDYVVTAHDITTKERLAVQNAFQKYIDAAISSTLNLDESTDVIDIMNLLTEASHMRLKGITVFRDGCRRLGILAPEEKKKPTTGMTCPECGGEMVMAGGCEECTSCGFSPCSV